MRILIVEDDDRIAMAIAEALQDHRYTVDIAQDGATGWDYVQSLDYHLILLDLMLPKLDGIILCRHIRQHKYATPILMLTAKDTSFDKVLGLDAGADDYVVKPFDLSELLARIRALLRRSPSLSPNVLEWGELKLDPSLCQVSYQETLLDLTPTEYKLLELFLRNPRRVFSKANIIDQLWSFTNIPGEETVKVHLKELRKKLKSKGANPDFIETVYGLGYRLKQQI